MDSIRNDPAWNHGEYKEEPKEGLVGAINILMMMTSSPLQWHRNGPTRDEADLTARAVRLLDRTDAGRTPIRLLGVSVHKFYAEDEAADPERLPFGEDDVDEGTDNRHGTHRSGT